MRGLTRLMLTLAGNDPIGRLYCRVRQDERVPIHHMHWTAMTLPHATLDLTTCVHVIHQATINTCQTCLDTRKEWAREPRIPLKTRAPLTPARRQPKKSKGNLQPQHHIVSR